MSALPALLARDELHARHLIERSSTATTSALLQAICAIARAGSGNRSVASVLPALQGEALRAVVGFVTRAAQSPAATNVPGWAQELVPSVVAEVLDLLADEGGVVARLPLTRVDLADGTAKLPVRTGRGLGAAFRAEGAPIRVGGLSMASRTLEGRSMGVIATASTEAIKAASDSVLERLIRGGMIADTAQTLDSCFFDAVPRDAVRPAGIQSGIDPADTTVSSGTTLEAITADARGRLAQLHARGLGRVASAVAWVMHSDLATALLTISDELRLHGSFLGVQVFSSLAVPDDVMFLLDCRGIGLASDVPTFESSSEALLHEDDGAPNADGKTGPTVDPIVDDAGVVAAPVRSLFGTHVTSVKGVWEVDWTVLAAGAVQTITGAVVTP